MAQTREFKVYVDGAARGNPGPAAYAFVIYHDGEPVLEDNGFLGRATNNVAEYTALVKALERAAELKATHLDIRSDSELLVRQMRGEYRVKNEHLRPLYEEASRLARRFEAVSISHVPREENREADRLCNEALDEAAKRPHRNRRPPARAPEASLKASGSSREEDWQSTLADAERLLSQKGVAPDQALQAVRQLVRLFQERGFLRPTEADSQ